MQGVYKQITRENVRHRRRIKPDHAQGRQLLSHLIKAEVEAQNSVCKWT